MRRERDPKLTGGRVVAIVGCVLFMVFVGRNVFFGDDSPWWRDAVPASSAHTAPISEGGMNPILQLLRSSATTQPVEGTAAVILVDVSGSMSEQVAGSGGSLSPKMQIARRCALDLVRQAQEFAKAHADRTIVLGVYEFSQRGDEASCRPRVAIGPPDASAAQGALAAMVPNGGTPIGDAILKAKQDLDATGLSRKHILVVTDGENTTGYTPGDVVSAISRLEEKTPTGIYLIAFDTEASQFQPITKAGGIVLSASNEQQLKGNLEYLLSGKILAEMPETLGKFPQE